MPLQVANDTVDGGNPRCAARVFAALSATGAPQARSSRSSAGNGCLFEFYCWTIHSVLVEESPGIDGDSEASSRATEVFKPLMGIGDDQATSLCRPLSPNIWATPQLTATR